MILVICITLNIKTVPCSSNGGMETSEPLMNAIANDVTLQLTHQTDAASNHSHPALFVVDSLPHADFVMKCTEAKAVQWPEVWKFYGSHTLLHFRTGDSEWCTQCQRKNSSRKR